MTEDEADRVREITRKMVLYARAKAPNMSVTVLMYPAEQLADVVVGTTEPDASHLRALLAEVIASSVLMEGVEVSDVADVATADYLARQAKGHPKA